ncbi:MAG: ATP-binding protein, partial [Anaerolineae bacterium]|nr:ATP-binding protein [Anaerolineae bacterium]
MRNLDPILPTTELTLATSPSPELQALLDSFPTYVMLIDAHHRIVAANRAVQRDLGMAPEEIVGGYCPKLVHGLDRPFPGCPLEEAARDGASVEKEFFDATTGRSVSSAIYLTPYRTPEGQAVFLHMTRDISDLKLAEEALQKREAYLRLVVEQVGAILWTTDDQLHLTFAYGGDRHNADAAFQDTPSLTIYGFFQTEDPAHPSIAAHFRALQGESAAHDHTWQEKIYRSQVEPLRNDSGDIIGTVGLAVDVTEYKVIEEKLRHQEQLAAVGRLTAGIAHDFRNLLSTITLYAQLSRQRKDMPPAVGPALDTIVQEVRRASELVQQILGFSSPSPVTLAPLDLSSLVSDLFSILRRTIREDIRLLLEIGPGNLVVKADATRMEQVLMNLVLNARDAMPKGGELRIVLTRVRTGLPATRNAGEISGGDWVSLAISDTGTGMSPDVVAHIYEPFFTTKGPGKGTGLGLAQVHDIVTQLGGHMNVETQVGQGCTFRIHMPVYEAEAAVVSRDAGHQGLSSGCGETILLVEDD